MDVVDKPSNKMINLENTKRYDDATLTMKKGEPMILTNSNDDAEISENCVSSTAFERPPCENFELKPNDGDYEAHVNYLSSKVFVDRPPSRCENTTNNEERSFNGEGGEKFVPKKNFPSNSPQAVSQKKRRNLTDEIERDRNITHNSNSEGTNIIIKENESETSDEDYDLSDLGEPIKEPSFFQKVKNFFNNDHSDEQETLSEEQKVSESHGQFETDIGKPFQTPLSQKVSHAWRDLFSNGNQDEHGSDNDSEEEPANISDNDLDDTDGPAQNSTGNRDKGKILFDCVDEKVSVAMLNGVPIRKKLRYNRTSTYICRNEKGRKYNHKVVTSRRSYMPITKQKTFRERFITWFTWSPDLRKEDGDEVDMVPKGEERYKIDDSPSGLFILINMHEFNGGNDLTRKGTNLDADKLTKLFLELGFIVERFDNPSKQEIETIMSSKAITKFDKSCFVCAILSHGDTGKIFAKDKSVDIQEMLSNFMNDSLRGIPKVFIIQACRGSTKMNQIKEGQSKERRGYKLELPESSDFLVAYATPPGYVSLRNNTHGSFFIRNLIEVFRERANESDIVSMLTRVSNKVSIEYGNLETWKDEDGKTHRYPNVKESPSFVCQLTKELYFNPLHDLTNDMVLDEEELKKLFK